MTGDVTTISGRPHAGLLRPDDESGEVDVVEFEFDRGAMAVRAGGRVVGSFDPNGVVWQFSGEEWCFTIGGETWRFAPHDLSQFTVQLAEVADDVEIDLTPDPPVTVIHGIGPATERSLAAIGVHTVRHLAEADDDTIQRIRDTIGTRFDRGSWVSRAQEAIGMAPVPERVAPPDDTTGPATAPPEDLQRPAEERQPTVPRLARTPAWRRRFGSDSSSPHDHDYEAPTYIGGLTRSVCSTCRHVTFTSEDIYEVG